MDMRNLYRSKRRLRWIVGNGLALITFASIGCDRSDRAAVAEPSAAISDSENAVKRSKKGMYSARIAQDSVVVGQPIEVALAIEPGNDLKINLDFPWKIEMQEREGVSFPTTSFSKADITLSEERATVPMVLNVAKAGEYDVEAIADFSVCNDDRCEILRGESVIVKVRAVEGSSE